MNTNTLTTQEKEGIIKFIKDVYPNKKDFLSYMEPFLMNLMIRDKYEKYLIILQKLDVNGIEKIAEMFSGIADTYSENTTELINGVMGIMMKKYEDSTTLTSYRDFMKAYSEECSVEYIIPFMAKADDAVYEKYGREYEELDERAEALPEDEKNIYEYFGVFITKLWLLYTVTNPKYPEPLMRIFLKDYLSSYYRRLEALYDIRLPDGLITYIESIKIPDEEKWRKYTPETEKEYIPQTLPIFQQQEDVYAILKNYFDVPQHNALFSLLQSGMCAIKLLFKSNGNQLADVFKKLYMANLITGCNKEELANWISLNFRFKGKKGKYASFDKKYLTNIISSELKPCKNPIMEVKKDEKGKTTLISPNRKNGSL